MSRKRKLNRTNRTFRFESLERREMMSATGWSAHDVDYSAADPTSLIAYVAAAEGQNAAPTDTEHVLEASATAAPTALVRAQQKVPYTVTSNGGTLQITANEAGYLIKVANYFKNPQTGRATLTISHARLPGVGGATYSFDVTGITKIAFTGTDGVDQFENNSVLTSIQRGKGGNDTLLGGWGTDYLYGGSGNDQLDGRDGHDELYGGKNGPTPIGSGAGGLGDRLQGGNGNDTLDGGAGVDYLDGGGDFDTAVNPQPSEKLSNVEHIGPAKLNAASLTQTPDGDTSTGPTAKSTLQAASLSSSPSTPGTLDTEFGDRGKRTQHFFTVEDHAKSVALQGDGPDAKLIVVGRIGDDVGIARFDADGDLDTSFGEWDPKRKRYMGFMKLNFSGYHEGGFGIAVDQESGQIFIAATINSGNESAVICLTKDGHQMDSSFGEKVKGGRSGYRVIDFKGGTDIALDLALDEDKNIFVVGSTDNEDATAAKLTRDGDIAWQTTFDFVARHCYATSVAIDRNGDVVVAGQGDKHGYGVARLSSTNGAVLMKTTMDFGTGTKAYDVAVDGENRIVVVGTTLTGRGFGIARLNPDGSPDKSFSLRNGEPTGGKVEIDWSGSDGARGVAIDPFDNGIYVVGRARSYGFGVVRLTDKGQLDRSFSPDGSDPGSGQAIAPFGGGAEAWGVALDHVRRVVVVGNDNYGDFAMARLFGTPRMEPGTIAIEPTTMEVDESAGNVVIKVKLDRGDSGAEAVSVDYTIVGSGPAAGESVPGTNGTLKFGPSQTEATIEIPIINDKLDESAEIIQVKLSNPTTGVKLGNDTSTITIVDDDPPNPDVPGQSSLKIQPVDSVVKQEGTGGTTTYRFQVTRLGDTSGETTVNWALIGSSNNGLNGADFADGKLPSGVVRFAAGSTLPQYIDIKVMGDANIESDEQFTLTLSNASGSANITTPSAHGTIQNDDLPLDNPSFLEITSKSKIVKQEGTGTTTTYRFQVNRRGNTSGYTTVLWAVTGTATNGASAADFFKGKLPSGGIGFNPGQKSAEIEVKVAGDAMVEANEQFIVTLSSQSSDAIITTASAIATINDDDVADPVPEAALNRHGRLVIQGGSLQIDADGSIVSTGDDNVSVSLVGNEVVVNFNGQEERFAVASVKAIEFHGGLGNDKFTNHTSIAAEAYGEAGSDQLIGGSGNDILRGGDGKDWIEGRDGNDKLYGAGSDDTLLGGAHDDQLFGGDGTDHLDGGAGSDRLEGGQGNDGMYGGDARDFLFGQEGDDWMYGGAGNDELYGLLGADRIYGEAGDDKLRGGQGNDSLYGGDGNDDLDGDEDDDNVHGDAGNDRIVSRDGVAGNDKLLGGPGANLIDAPKIEIV